jgi:hypothetical protein
VADTRARSRALLVSGGKETVGHFLEIRISVHKGYLSLSVEDLEGVIVTAYLSIAKAENLAEILVRKASCIKGAQFRPRRRAVLTYVSAGPESKGRVQA